MLAEVWPSRMHTQNDGLGDSKEPDRRETAVHERKERHYKQWDSRQVGKAGCSGAKKLDEY